VTEGLGSVELSSNVITVMKVCASSLLDHFHALVGKGSSSVDISQTIDLGSEVDKIESDNSELISDIRSQLHFLRRTDVRCLLAETHSPEAATKALMKMEEARFLLLWVNYTLKMAGSQRRVQNFASDFADFEVFGVLLTYFHPSSSKKHFKIMHGSKGSTKSWAGIFSPHVEAKKRLVAIVGAMRAQEGIDRSPVALASLLTLKNVQNSEIPDVISVWVCRLFLDHCNLQPRVGLVSADALLLEDISVFYKSVHSMDSMKAARSVDWMVFSHERYKFGNSFCG